MASSIMEQHASIQASTLNLQVLKTPVTYQKNSCAWFHKKIDPRWELSNMSGGMPLKFDNKKWNSSEQLYQASKYPSNAVCIPTSSMTAKGSIPNVRDRIESMTNAKGAKMTQKCAVKAGLVRADWDDPLYEIRIHSMLWVLETKLYFNPSTFGKILRDTGNDQIVEISSNDFFWGCKDLGNGMLGGQNVLGKLLEIVRSRRSQTMVHDYLYKDGFLLI